MENVLLSTIGNFRWKQYKRILCIRPDNLGDVLMTQPALRALKHGTTRHLTLLTSTAGAAVAKYMAEVDDIIVFDTPWVKAKNSGGPQKVSALAKRLASRKFDAAVIFTNYSQSSLPAALLCYLAGIPDVLAYSRENPYLLIPSWVPDSEPFTFPVHGVERQLNLVKAVGALAANTALSLVIPKREKESARIKLKKLGLAPGESYLILHAGASEPRRHYPAEVFVKAAKRIWEQTYYKIILTGSGDERRLTATMAELLPDVFINAAGQFNVGEFAEVIAGARVVITNNTGPAHIAAAVKTPVVVLYARTNPEHAPWQVESRVLYFDVPPDQRSKNTLLKQTTPNKARPLPSPGEIMAAALSLLKLSSASKLRRSVLSWH